MRYEWEEHDITSGRQVDSHNRAERYIIGYDPSIDHSAGNITLTSLRDGMQAHKGLTEAAMAEQLNKSNMRPVLVSLDDIKATK